MRQLAIIFAPRGGAHGAAGASRPIVATHVTQFQLSTNQSGFWSLHFREEEP
jgi:hypothetical protein